MQINLYNFSGFYFILFIYLFCLFTYYNVIFLIIFLQILGTIIAPPKEAWENVDVEDWILFQKVEGLSLIGNEQGVINGRGDTWWGPRVS